MFIFKVLYGILWVLEDCVLHIANNARVCSHTIWKAFYLLLQILWTQLYVNCTRAVNFETLFHFCQTLYTMHRIGIFFFVSSLVRVLVVLRNWCNNNKLVNLVFSTMSLQLRFTKARVNRCSEYNQPFEYKRWSY